MMNPDVKRNLARRWAELCQPPPYILQQTKDMFVSADGAYRPLRASRMKATSALITWILPLDFVDTSAVLDEGESTASIDQVVGRLRQSLEVKKAWEPILDHGRKCMRLAGGEDVAICMELCPGSLELQKIVRFHVHALVRSCHQQLAMQHLWKFEFQSLPVHLSHGIRGVHSTRARAQWSGFLYCCL